MTTRDAMLREISSLKETEMPTTTPITTSAPKEYQVVLSAEQLATIRVALEAEAEHARDAARDAAGDSAASAQYLAIAERNERLWQQMGEVAQQ